MHEKLEKIVFSVENLDLKPLKPKIHFSYHVHIFKISKLKRYINQTSKINLGFVLGKKVTTHGNLAFKFELINHSVLTTCFSQTRQLLKSNNMKSIQMINPLRLLIRSDNKDLGKV